MSDLNSIKASAKRLAQKLDRMDGKDGKILANTWENIFNAKEKGAKAPVRQHISVERAEVSILAYLKRNEQTEEAQNDLCNKWFDSLSEKTDNENNQNEVPAIEDEINGEEVVSTNSEPNPLQEVKTETKQIPVLETNQNLTVPTVSTYVAPTQPYEAIKETADLAKSLPDPTTPLIRHEMSQTIANEWALVFNIDNNDKSFTQFVDKLYDVIKDLNISNLTFEYDKTKYATKEDQIVDELCRLFANESQFNSKITNGNQVGIFQFTPVGLQDLLDKTVNGNELFNFDDLKFAKGETVVTKAMYKNMNKSQRYSFCQRYLKNNFSKLSRIEQLEYFTKHIQNCKDNYSHLNNKPVSVAQVYSMNWYPADGNLKSRIDNRKSVMQIRTNERIAVCNRKMGTQQPIKS